MFLSTDEKLGEALDALDPLVLGEALAPPEALLLGEALGLLGDALELLGDALELGPDAPLELAPDAPLLAPPVLCASEALASANRAAAVAVPTTFNNMRIPPRGLGENCSANDAMSMPSCRAGMGFPCICRSCTQLHSD